MPLFPGPEKPDNQCPSHGALQMTDQDIVDGFNAQLPTFMKFFNAEIIDVDVAAATCTFAFDVSTDYCHSVNVVQGGFITSMLDAAMSHALFAIEGGRGLINVSSLEIKTSYLAPTLAGKMTALGRVRKAAYKTAFLEAELFNAEGELTATTSSVAKIVRKKD